MSVRQSRPHHLSDPFHDFTEEHLYEILDTRDDQLEWHHFQSLLGPFVPAGTYDEVIYFYPKAFSFVLENDEAATNLVTSLVWFASEFADRLANDGLLDVTRQNLTACFDHWTDNFNVIYFNRRRCKEKGWGIGYFDYVKHSEVICEGTCALVKFKTHSDLAESFVRSLANHSGNAMKAAWFLEYARSRNDVYHPPRHTGIQGLLNDRHLLLEAANVVLEKMVDAERSPTYWEDTFRLLGL